MLDVTNNVVQFHELPSQYIDPEAPEMLTASNLIPGAVYWTIRSIVSCASHVLGRTGLGQGYLTSTTETWELSSLAHKLDNINTHLRMQLTLCPQHLEAFETLRLLFERSHQDNSKVLKAMFCSQDDSLPLFDGSSKQRLNPETVLSSSCSHS
ncbi:Protein SIEVE ELEMENT OCCLUSION B [Glycine max]|nr:Protein SIEVE ELEMENT OCCLUSION B [Glycine max]